MTSIMNLDEGDLVKIKGIEGKNTIVDWFGQLLSKPSKTKIEVILLETQPNGTMEWGQQYSFPIESVSDYSIIPNKFDRKDHCQAWKYFGIRILKASAAGDDIFCEIEKEEEIKGTVDIGSEEYEPPDDDDETESLGSLKNFIVPDSEAEPFTPADPSTSDFVQETHEIVHAHNDYVPKNKREREYMDFINAIEARVTHQLDDQMFAKGKSCPNVQKPPLRKKTKRR